MIKIVNTKKSSQYVLNIGGKRGSSASIYRVLINAIVRNRGRLKKE